MNHILSRKSVEQVRISALRPLMTFNHLIAFTLDLVRSRKVLWSAAASVLELRRIQKKRGNLLRLLVFNFSWTSHSSSLQRLSITIKCNRFSWSSHPTRKQQPSSFVIPAHHWPASWVQSSALKSVLNKLYLEHSLTRRPVYALSITSSHLCFYFHSGSVYSNQKQKMITWFHLLTYSSYMTLSVGVLAQM